MKCFLTLICLLMAQWALGQAHPYSPKLSLQIEESVHEGTITPARAGTLLSFIGEYHISNMYSDIPVSWGVDTLDLDQYDVQQALPYIIESAKNHQIVMISENHLKPQHRIFAKHIITELSHLGFNHLGLETFTNMNNSNVLLDSHLQERGYPLNTPLTGTYTLEPQMGHLVRTAIEHDYYLFGYERSKKLEGMDRDEIQADNVIRYLKNHPDAKIVILCGLHHAIESDLPKRGNNFWLAKYLKDKTGIDPLTIYQDNFTEKFAFNEHPILRQLSIPAPSVFVNENQQVARLTKHVDIEVIHPKTYFIDGRPHWLFENPNYHSISVKKIEGMSYPQLISVFKTSEMEGSSIDQIEKKHQFDKKVIVLTKGTYRIKITDGKLENEYIYSVQ